MCPDSKIVNKYGYGHTKTTLMLTGEVAKENYWRHERGPVADSLVRMVAVMEMINL